MSFYQSKSNPWIQHSKVSIIVAGKWNNGKFCRSNPWLGLLTDSENVIDQSRIPLSIEPEVFGGVFWLLTSHSRLQEYLYKLIQHSHLAVYVYQKTNHLIIICIHARSIRIIENAVTLTQITGSVMLISWMIVDVHGDRQHCILTFAHCVTLGR